MLLIVWVRHVEHPFSRRQVHDADWVIFFLWTAFVLYDATCIPETSPLPLSPQNYPLHSSEVNGFHSAPTTYNHTPTINGEGIMGKEPLKRARRKLLRHWFDGYVVRLSCFFQINKSSDSHLFYLCSQPRHHSWQFRRWNWKGSCLSEFFSLCLLL